MTRVWLDYVRPFADEIVTDAYGNAFAILNPKGSPSVMFEGHSDEIALMVNYIDEEGYLWVSGIGGVDTLYEAVTTLNAKGPSKVGPFTIPMLLVDLAVLAGFIMVALRSKRFWPLWVAGLQLTTSVGHMLKGVDQDLLPQAYGAALQFWGYPILIILAVGTFRTDRRMRRAAS